MILIFSKSSLESSTNSIIDWLEYYEARYFRINGDELDAQKYFLEISNSDTNVLDLKICPNDVNVVWFRRWGNYAEEYNDIKIENDLDFENSLNKYLYSEYRSLSYALFNMFDKSYWLSEPPNRMSDDKIGTLRKAKKQGLNIPRSYILNTKKQLFDILENNIPELINKSIFNVGKIVSNNKRYVQYTQSVNKETLKHLPETFFPSLFQEKIEKEYEIRAFYLEGDIYSMVIFSQFDTQTAVDFRKYNFDKPNRTIPYQLPIEIENKIKNLMNAMGLQTGSIDIIKSIRGDYVFLEINPVGQFGMVSYPCNYNLEKKIAEFLIKKDNERTTDN